MPGDICTDIERATKDLTPGSSPEAAAPLLEVLKELNQSHIEKTDLMQRAQVAAKSLDAKGEYSAEIDSGVAGAIGTVQQQDGKANWVALVEGNRTESMRLDRNGVPSMSTIAQKCGDTLIVSYFFLRDGKRVLSSVQLPPTMEILIDRDGKPNRVKSIY